MKTEKEIRKSAFRKSRHSKTIICRVCKKEIDYFLINVHLNKHESEILVTRANVILEENKGGF